MKEKDVIISLIISSLDTINPIEIQKSIAIYNLLKELYKRNNDVSSNIEFQWAYKAYYGLVHYSKIDLPTYFQVFQQYLNDRDKPLDICDVIKELHTEKKNVSFSSKMMNFVDDTKYPIIDSRISKVFGFYNYENISEKYQLIKDVYTTLATNRVIVEFVRKFEFEGIGLMKQLDIIVWNIMGKRY